MLTRCVNFTKKLRRLTFFDPACGCGNFLRISYRELRLRARPGTRA
ncbi:DNA methyltransferase [Polaromonas sp. CG_9.7]